MAYLARECGVDEEELQKRQQEASEEGAPLNALKKHSQTGAWIVVDDVIAGIDKALARMRANREEAADEQNPQGVAEAV